MGRARRALRCTLCVLSKTPPRCAPPNPPSNNTKTRRRRHRARATRRRLLGGQRPALLNRKLCPRAQARETTATPKRRRRRRRQACEREPPFLHSAASTRHNSVKLSNKEPNSPAMQRANRAHWGSQNTQQNTLQHRSLGPSKRFDSVRSWRSYSRS